VPKKKILIFIDWFTPGYKAGGPIRSVANIIDNTHQFFDFTVITSDRDLGDTKPYNIELNVFVQKDTFRIIYISPENQNSLFLKQILEKIDFDIAYYNSVFSIKFTFLPIRIIRKNNFSAKQILAPRGMFGAGAINIKKYKKTTFLLFAKHFNIYKNIIWHATTVDEKYDILKYFRKSLIKVAPNLSKAPKANTMRLKEKNKLKIIFISRISQKKNLKQAIKILTKIGSNYYYVFDIYGPIEDSEYYKLCQEQVKQLSDHVKVSFLGDINHNKIDETLKQYHLFFLPTSHENFGHSIIEALSAGCPVLISDQTPWRNLEEKRIGWDIALSDVKKFVKVLENCAEMGQEEYNMLSDNAFEFAKKTTQNPENVELTKQLFLNA